MHSVYYLIYGIKLTTNTIHKMLEHMIFSGDYVEEIYDFTDETDPGIILDFFMDEDYDTAAEFLREEGVEYIEGDYYVGKINWSTGNIPWSECVLATEENIFEISDEDVASVDKTLEDLKDNFPEEITNSFPQTGFYWIMGTN